MIKSDLELCARLKQGDTKAFDTIFKKYFQMLCIYAADILKSREAAEEMVQDIFVKLWNVKDAIDFNVSLKAYLFRMVHNRCLNYVRDHPNQNTISLEDVISRVKIMEIESPHTYDIVLKSQIEEDLEIAIQDLPDQCKEIFFMARYKGNSYSEIAEKLNISVSTVKTQMIRAMDKLKSSLSRYLSED